MGGEHEEKMTETSCIEPVRRLQQGIPPKGTHSAVSNGWLHGFKNRFGL